MARSRPPAPQIASPDDVEAELYEAMRSADLDRLMAVWSDDDEIVCVHPGGTRLVGAQAIRAGFASIFGNGRVDIEAHGVRRVETHACTVHSVLERIRVQAADGERVGWVLATNVYVRATHGWRLVAHHASPGAAEEEGVVAASQLH